MNRLKEGPAIPSWVGVTAIVVVVAIAAFFLFRSFVGQGPLDKSKYPPQAYQAPGYGGGARNPYAGMSSTGPRGGGAMPPSAGARPPSAGAMPPSAGAMPGGYGR